MQLKIVIYLLFFVLSQAEWRALPANNTQVPVGNDVYAAGYDMVTAIQVLPNNASVPPSLSRSSSSIRYIAYYLHVVLSSAK